jgi:uncharacterized membrane protein
MQTTVPDEPTTERKQAPYLIGGLYIVAGLAHFLATSTYMRIMPSYLPAPHRLVFISGLAEIAGGLGLLYAPTRRAAAWGIILLLIAVWPANLWMAQHPQLFPNVPVWAAWLRLPLQLPLIYWAWQHTRHTSPERIA